jgi:hypothetical protein
LLGKERHRRAFDVPQIPHEIVEWHKTSGCGILQQQLKTTLGFTVEHRNVYVPASIEIDGVAIKHRQTAGPVESSDYNRDASGAERAGDIEGARILVRLDADERKQPKTAVTAKMLEQFGDVNARMGLVNCLDVDYDVRPENSALCAIGFDAVDGGQGIRRSNCVPPAYHVTIVVIMRWLHENELEVSSCGTEISKQWCMTSRASVAKHLPDPAQLAMFKYAADRGARTFLRAKPEERMQSHEPRAGAVVR